MLRRDDSPGQVLRQVRCLFILHEAHRLGYMTVPIQTVHAVAYFTDLLAPVWNLPVLEERLLKRGLVPTHPDLQQAFDLLVGSGLAVVQDVVYRPAGRDWELLANCRLNGVLADPMLKAALEIPGIVNELQMVRETVRALAGLGLDGLEQVTSLDPTYGDPTLDIDNIVDLLPEGHVNRSIEIARSFERALGADRGLAHAELTHLYVRYLYSLLDDGDGK